MKLWLVQIWKTFDFHNETDFILQDGHFSCFDTQMAESNGPTKSVLKTVMDPPGCLKKDLVTGLNGMEAVQHAFQMIPPEIVMHCHGILNEPWQMSPRR